MIKILFQTWRCEVDKSAQQQKFLRQQRKLGKLWERGGMKTLLPLAKRGRPNETVIIKRAIEYAVIRTPIGARLVLDSEGRLWDLTCGICESDGKTEALHLDYPIELTFGPDGWVQKAIMQRPKIDFSSPADYSYARYLGLV